MARHQPDILIGNDAHSVINADALWCVTYYGEPVAFRTGTTPAGYIGYKYPRSSWASPGHAVNMAQKLNELYNTDKFAVAELAVKRVLSVEGLV